MRTISLKLPEDLLANLDNQASARRVTKSELVRESLVRFLQDQPSAATASCYDFARDLAGSVKGLPEDLADDPKYLEGLGQRPGARP
jgi:Arc/MetJ-type ribon-helix-helix transcriptional regulator